MDDKAFLGVIAVSIGFIGYAPYFRDIFKGKTKPHAFSWLVWGVLTGIAFVGQVVSGGGAGAWVTGFTAVICLAIFSLALSKGKKDFPFVDWMSLVGAGFALLLWFLTEDPLAAVILVSVIDALGFIPTYRKSYARPSEETLFTYNMSSLKFVVGLFALGSYSLVTVLYPLSLIVSNTAFVILLITRRKQLGLKR